MILRPRQRVYRPVNDLFEINYQSPQFHGLLNWWPAGGTEALTRYRKEYIHNRYGTLNDIRFVDWGTHPEIGVSTWHNSSGSSGYVDLGIQNQSAPFAVCVWCVPYFANSSGYQRYAKVFVQPTSAFSNPWLIWSMGITDASPASWLFEVSSGAANSTISSTATTTLTANTPYHLVGTYDGAYVRLYVNGVLAGSPSATTLSLGTSAQPTYMGRLRPYISDSYFYGLIGDVRIYERALSADDVWQLYDPATRWELYASPTVMRAVKAPAAVAGVSRQFMHYQRLRRAG